MLFSDPVKSPIHVSGVYYPTDPRAWSRPSGNTDFAITQKFGPTSVSVEPARTWAGGEGIAAGYYAHFHSGIDIANRMCGDAIYAAAAGTVKYVSRDGGGALYIEIDHGTVNGHHFVTGYWHEASQLVVVGQKVANRQKIATVGSTGNSTGCHLHFMIWKDGQIVDPLRRLASFTSVDPDYTAPAPTTEADMIITKNLDGSTANVAAGYNVRSAPNPTAAAIRVTSAVEKWTLIGITKGTPPAGQTSTDWYVRLNGTVWEFVYTTAVSGVAAPAPSGISAAQDAANVLAAKQAQYDTDARSIAVTQGVATAKLSNLRPV